MSSSMLGKSSLDGMLAVDAEAIFNVKVINKLLRVAVPGHNHKELFQKLITQEVIF